MVRGSKVFHTNTSSFRNNATPGFREVSILVGTARGMNGATNGESSIRNG